MNNTPKISRRNFVRQSTLAAAAFTIVPRHVLGGKGFVPPSDTLYIAGIGVGGKGTSDLTGFAAHPNAKIAFLCDVDDRRAQQSRKNFKDALFFKDYRQMLEKEHQNIDAVSVSTPDHSHAVQALAAMQLGKHVYVQKPLTHDVYEARALTQAAEKYKVVTQMGNQGASGDGVRKMREWYDADLIGDAEKIYVWTDRPVWPQGIAWSANAGTIPSELDWDLWLGTAPKKEYVEKLVPFNWRGWWDYGTGALGDMACHLIEPAFVTVGLNYPTAVECSIGSVYVDEFKKGHTPESCPPSSHVILTFPNPKGGKPIKLHWMDGGIQPERPEELAPNETMGDGGNGVIIVGTKGKMMCGTYGENPRLLPTSKTAETNVAETLARVPEGHYQQWVAGCLAGYGQTSLSSPFSIAGPLTESILMGNLAIRSAQIRVPSKLGRGFTYPGANIQLSWDAANMKITNFDEANEFVRRTYRKGWEMRGL